MHDMNKSIVVKFISDEWLPETRDGLDYQVRYTFVDSVFVDKPEEVLRTKQGHIIVGISGTLNSMWGLTRDDLRKVLFEYAKRHIGKMVSEGALVKQTEVQLTSVSAPSRCPFDPQRINIAFGVLLQFSLPAVNPLADAKPSSVAFQIVDLRDSINAIFGERFNGRILTLPQERHLVELFKSCGSREEFVCQVASLGGLAISIEPKSLKALRRDGGVKSKVRKDHPLKSQENPKPLDLLGTFLRNRYPAGKVNAVMDALQNFNQLRRIYPIHITIKVF